MNETDSTDWIRRLAELWGDAPSEFRFGEVVEVLTGHAVRPLALDATEEDARVVAAVVAAADEAMSTASAAGLRARRANEAGLEMERFVIAALKHHGLSTDRPMTRGGRRKASGYPDLELSGAAGHSTYLELKTYSMSRSSDTYRTFFFSVPSDEREWKIGVDACHLLLSFAVVTEDRDGEQVRVPVGWLLRDLSNLKVRLKLEFNANNTALYASDGVVAANGVCQSTRTSSSSMRS
jgi:hypothetical protein